MTIRHETRQNGLEDLLDWFKINGRDFPWRNTQDPFKVLVAEKLLQQTSVNEHVVNAYREIVETYPTPGALSLAELDDVEQIVLPLGLKYRATELIRMAREIQDEFQGEVPAKLSEILRLSGVGQYCGRAVLCFAFSQTVPIVDTNIARFLNRFLGLSERLPANPARSKRYQVSPAPKRASAKS